MDLKMMAAPDEILLLGIDGGGSGCRARLARCDGQVLGEGEAGPANLRLGIDMAFAEIGAATRKAMSQAGRAEAGARVIACLALAGASEPKQHALALARAHGFLHRSIVTDAHAACVGAHGGADGGIVIVGTGSIGWAILHGDSYRIGGHGLILSDEGSGAWLGREALRHVLRWRDGLAPPSGLAEELLARFDGDRARLVEWADCATPGAFASLAPHIVRNAAAGDPVATALLGDAGRHIGALLDRLRELSVPRLSLMGGLADTVKQYLPDDKRTFLTAPRGDALSGALRLAREAAQSHFTTSPATGKDPRVKPSTTWMAKEIAEAPDVVACQDAALGPGLRELATRLKSAPPQVVVTCARGSSAHAAAFAKHLIEAYMGLPVSPAAPSVVSVYGHRLCLRNQLVLAISQSGRSDDIIAYVAAGRRSGALTVAMTNDVRSPLAAGSDIVLPIGAGAEVSIAATKTFIATCSALLRLVALWSGDRQLEAGIGSLPRRLKEASQLDWSPAVRVLAAARSLVSIGRGPTLAIAREAALKLKETCNLHAEAFSGAEFLHGPVALVTQKYPILLLIPEDAAATGMRELAVDLQAKGTSLIVAGRAEAGISLPTLAPLQPEADALCLIQSLYGMIVDLAQDLAIDVDRPRNLRKITRTT